MSKRSETASRAPGRTTRRTALPNVPLPERDVLAIAWVVPPNARTVLGSSPHVLGREARKGTVIPGDETSRRHAQVWRSGRGGVIEDLGSVNKVFVNGSKHERSELWPGDVLRVGEGLGVVTSFGPNLGDTSFSEIVPGWFGGGRLKRLVEPLRSIARTQLSVVIQGESGVGKEELCAAIHHFSEREGPLVAVDCGAIAEGLAESELFGHRQGAFTGATHDRQGYLLEASGGTLFLDEVVNLPLALQTKLLRVLEKQEVRRLGETRTHRVDVRVVVAAQEPLAATVESGKFRHDLCSRLEGYVVSLPPLRERREDIGPLFLELLRRTTKGRPPEVDLLLLEALCLNDWPRNVRGLLAVVGRLVALYPNQRLEHSMLAQALAAESRPSHRAPGSGRRSNPRRISTTNEASLEQLKSALARLGGNVTHAAESLGISRSRANRIIKEHPGFDIAGFRARKSSQEP